MVGRRVEDQAVGVLQLHARDHTTHLLASREHVDLLLHLLLAEEHASEVGLHRHLVARAVLREPVDEVLVALDVEADVVEEDRAVGIDRLEVFDHEDLVARLALHLEDDARILAAGGTDLLDVELLEHLLAGCGLLTLCHVSRESADELFQLLFLFLGLHLLVLSLAQSQL